MKNRVQKKWALYAFLLHILIAVIGIYLDHELCVVKIQFGLLFAAFVFSLTEINGERMKIGSGMMLGTVAAMGIYLFLVFFFFFRINADC